MQTGKLMFGILLSAATAWGGEAAFSAIPTTVKDVASPTDTRQGSVKTGSSVSAPADVKAPDIKSLPPNRWLKLDKAAVNRRDAPLIYEPALERFMVLGGNIDPRDYAPPHPFDELALDLTCGLWENWIPRGKSWGPPFGDCQPPGWKGSVRWTMTDAEGNCRPIVTGTIMRYSGYAFDTDSRRTYFYAAGSTFCYDAAARAWKDLAPGNHPGKVGGTLY